MHQRLRVSTADRMRLFSAVVKATAEVHGVDEIELTGSSRKRAVAWPRQEAFAALRTSGFFSLQEIGRMFGRDHTTVLYALRLVSERPNEVEKIYERAKALVIEAREHHAKANKSQATRAMWGVIA